MNGKRLYRSSDAVFGGVCGGIAEYFGIDPTLVRIIAVALTIVGFGFPALLYVVLMVVLSPDPGIARGYVDTRAETTQPSQQQVSASVSASPSAEAVRNHSSTVLIVGAVFIGMGIIALLCNFIHVSVWRFWPLVLVVVGVICLFTPGAHGWSLGRAGNAIVLITLGLALLAWMLGIVHTWVFKAALRDLWPVLLVVVGLTIIGSVRKSSVVCLLSSLVLSATILLGLWFYGGLDWEMLGNAALVIDSDGLHEFFSEVSLVSQAG
ncbi:MAG: PspC domain-containing protein [Coriobacteriales bacterium]|jgi:phage shock protein C|nr:PspC domain-containing protein [Coriobacteriales bacterium]